MSILAGFWYHTVVILYKVMDHYTMYNLKNSLKFIKYTLQNNVLN